MKSVTSFLYSFGLQVEKKFNDGNTGDREELTALHALDKPKASSMITADEGSTYPSVQCQALATGSAGKND